MGYRVSVSEVGPPVIPLLRKALTDNDPHIRAGGAATLAQMGNFDKTWGHNNPDTRRMIVFASAADLALPHLHWPTRLKIRTRILRQQAAIALAYADPSDSRVCRFS